MNSIPVPLESGYSAEFDTVDKFEWCEIINRFSDANIYQTWSYGAVRWGEKNISHLILREGGKIIAVAQTQILRIPFVNLGVAYVLWGPLWRLRNEAADPASFRFAARALKNEYVYHRGLILRIFPELFDDNTNSCLDILLQEGYARVFERVHKRTLILDIRPSIEELRKKLDQKWRNCLNRAERNDLEVVGGTDDSLFEKFVGIYEDMLQRKKFPEPNDINEFRMIQRELPDQLKMRIFLCHSNGLSSAGGIFTAIGETGVYLFGATNDQGMVNKGSYLIQWKAIQWMKNSGCRYYNLNGINPITNPGTYHFKVGLSGKSGKDVHFLGSFECCSGWVNTGLAHTAKFIFPFTKKVISIFRIHGRSKVRDEATVQA